LVCPVTIGKTQLSLRFLAQESGFPLAAMEAGRISPRQWARLESAARRLEAMPLWIFPRGRMRAAEWQRKVRNWLRRHRVDLLAISVPACNPKERKAWDVWVRGTAKSAKCAVVAARVLPRSIWPELCVLGAMILDPPCIDRVVRIVREKHFARPVHRALFRLLAEMRAGGKRIDLVTVRDELRDRGKAEKVGGFDYVVSLAEWVPNADNAERYARLVLRGLKAPREKGG
jgi:replicative DNA helicase